jgi:uncharacterized protein (UPF0335 family)
MSEFTQSEDVVDPAQPIGGNARTQLRSIVERIEHLEEEKKGIVEDIRGVYQEGRGNGFDVKALRAIVKRRAQDKAALAEHEAVLALYMDALGMV